MRAYDLIRKKRDKETLTKEEIEYFVQNYAEGTIPDYQAAAFLMATYLNGMNSEETSHLTLAMMNSGDVIDLSDINGIKVDKHSTGGVGDKTSIALGPIIAACGVPVAKISGRGLGHTGGTLDKLESFKGFNFELTRDQFVKSVNEIGIALAGQTSNLVPADKKIYALRDVTATVGNISLISGSIMSKKLASGADAIVLDVKCGAGGFMHKLEEARELASNMVEIGRMLDRKTVACVTNMDQPLGNAVGNSLEVIEAIETLKGKGSDELLELCIALGGQMILLGGKANSKEEAEDKIREVIANGKALDKLKEFVANQNGEVEGIDDYSKLPQAGHTKDVKSLKSGYVSSLDALQIGVASMYLGAGRETKESEIDLAAGLFLHKKIGDRVEEGDVLATMYYNRTEKVGEVEKMLLETYVINNDPVESSKLILDFVE